jgi:hypothetical protein
LNAAADRRRRATDRRRPRGRRAADDAERRRDQDTLSAHQFSAATIVPNAQQQGFLFFPLAEYTSARAVLTDTESEEDEGVRVEF